MPTRRPSNRNLAIYRTVIVEARSVRTVAAEVKLSSARVHAICQAVERFVSETPLPEVADFNRFAFGQQLRRTLIEQLEFLRQQAMQEWYRSQEPQETLKVSTEEQLAAEGEKRKPGKRVATSTRRTRAGAVSALALASRLAERIFTLRGGTEHDAEFTRPPNADPEQLAQEFSAIVAALGERQRAIETAGYRSADGLAPEGSAPLVPPHAEPQADDVPRLGMP